MNHTELPSLLLELAPSQGPRCLFCTLFAAGFFCQARRQTHTGDGEATALFQHAAEISLAQADVLSIGLHSNMHLGLDRSHAEGKYILSPLTIMLLQDMLAQRLGCKHVAPMIEPGVGLLSPSVCEGFLASSTREMATG